MGNPLLTMLLGLTGAALLLVLVFKLTDHAHRWQWITLKLAASFALGMAALVAVVSWLLPSPPAAVPADAFNQLLAQRPAAAGSSPRPRFALVGLRVLGTPSDRDQASPSERHAYSTKLAAALGDSVLAEGISTNVDAQALPTEAWPGTEHLGRCQDHDLLVTIRLPAVRLPEQQDYALWREPSFELLWCGSGARQTERFRVLERPGDQVPYEQAVRGRLLSLLRRTPKA